MILDKLAQFSDAQAITAAADSTNVYDQGVVGGRDIGAGKQLFLVVSVDVAPDADKTIIIALQGDTTDTITPDSTANVLTIPLATALGAKFVIPLAPGLAPLQLRYINIRYTPSSPLSAGSFSAYITLDYDTNKTFAAGVATLP